MIPVPELGLMLHPAHAKMYEKSEAYRRMWANNPPYRIPIGDGVPRGTNRVELPVVDCRTCANFGDEMKIDEVLRLGLSTQRRWNSCTAVKAVCVCKLERQCQHYRSMPSV